jgi:two-component system, cell cycle response regulator
MHLRDSTPTASDASGIQLAAAARSDLRVLVVDDDDSAREALEAAVRLLGYECVVARDGQEAWEIHQRERADVILSDWQMPRMDGVELCRRTRLSAEEDSYTYFIFMTGYADRDHFARGVDAGADDYHTKPVDLDELRARLASASRVLMLHKRLAEKATRLRRDSENQFNVARIDALTHVSNRLSLDEELRNIWSRVKRYGHRYSLAIGDLDGFKDYNDAFGHLAGDGVLQRVARTIRDELREGDGLYRYGGDEFVVLLPEQSLTEAARAMERVRAAVEHLAIPLRRVGIVTASFGVAELDPIGDMDPDTWFKRADAALYRAKTSGRNRVEADESIA